jgi:predicted acylesterase/phospholipase RssA
MPRTLAAALGVLLASEAAAAQAPPPLPQEHPAVRELRLGVVCYGGISLAIYMFGQTRELHHLALASSALECDAQTPGSASAAAVCGAVTPGEAWETLPASARPYYAALVDNWRTERVRTRVVVDVISGTSAGGINGILLAKALAHGAPLEGLRKLWFEQADIRKLATGRPWPLRAAWRLLRGKSALRGNSWLAELHSALVAMDGASATGEAARLPSLLAPEQTLDLLVTATDFYGSQRLLEIGDPPSSWEGRHDHVFRFAAARRPDGRVTPSDFTRDGNAALAFAARSSASFPVAFPAVRLADLEGLVEPRPDTAALARRLFPEQLAERADPGAASDLAQHLFLVDGGVLDNYPIGIAHRAASRRSPRLETRRVLLYLEPDPRLPSGAAPEPGAPDPRDPDGPNALQMLLAGKSGIPSAQPIAQDLLEIVRHNQRVARINDVVRRDEEEARTESGMPLEATSDSVASRVEEALGLRRGDLEEPAQLETKMPARLMVSGEGETLAPAPSAAAGGASEADLLRIRAMRRQLEERAGSGLPEMEEAYLRLRVQSVLDQLALDLGSVVCALPAGHEGPRASVLRAMVFAWAAQQQYLGDSLTRERRDELLHAYDLGYLRRNLRFVDDWLEVQYDPARYNTLEAEQVPLSRSSQSYGLDRDQVQRARAAIATQVDRITDLIRGRGLDDPRLVAEIERTRAAVCRPIADFERTPAELAESLLVPGLFDDLERELRRVLLDFQAGVLAALYDDFVRETSDWPPEAARAVLARYLGFPFWDRVAYPFTAYSGTGDLAHVEVMRFSPNDTSSLSGRKAAKLAGTKLGHFGAFFSADGRQRDYVWGRLDGAERVLALLRRRSDAARLRELQGTIVGEERADGDVTEPNLRFLEACVRNPGSC